MMGIALVVASSSKLPLQKEIGLGLQGSPGDNIALVVDISVRRLHDI